MTLSSLAIKTAPESPLIDLLDALESGSRPSGGVGGLESGVVSVGAEHLNGAGGFNFENVRFIPPNFYSAMKRGRISQGDILLVKDGATTGKVSFVSGDFPFEQAAVNEHVFILRPTAEKIVPKFLFYYLSSGGGQRQIKSAFHGAAIGGINRSFAARTFVPVPAIAEQKRLIGAFDIAYGIHARRQVARVITARIISALFQEVFGDPSTSVDRAAPLGEVLDRIQGGWSPLCEGRSVMEGEWGVLKLGAITTGVYSDVENKALPDYVAPRTELEVKRGDVLFCRKNTLELVGTCAYVVRTRPRLMFPDLMFRLIMPQKSLVLPTYLWAVLSHPNSRKRLQSIAAGSAGSMPNISMARLAKIKIPVPSLDLQVAFDREIDRLTRVAELQNDADEAGEELIRILLGQAFA